MADKRADQFDPATSQDLFVSGTDKEDLTDGPEGSTRRFNLSGLSHASTGVFTGGVLTFATVSTIDVATVAGVVNDLTDTFPNQSHPIKLDAFTYNANVAVDGTFLLLIDKLGATSQQLLDASDPVVRRRDFLFLGAFTVSGGAIVSVVNAKLSPLEPAQQLFDLLAGLGTIRFSGLAFSIIAGGTYSVTSGILASIGAGASGAGRAQNQIDIPAEVPQSFIYVLGKTGTFLPGTETQLQSDIFDDGNVTADTIGGGGNQATIQYIFKLPSDDSVNYIVLGQEVYATMDDAEAAASSDQANLIVPDLLAKNALLVDRIVMQKTISDWEDMAEFTTLGGSIFGSTVLGGSAIGGGGGDFFGPASSQVNELLTFASGTGKTGLAASDISVIAGVIERITNGEDLWLKVDASNENVFIGRHVDGTGVPSLTNTTLLVTANATNNIALVTLGNNSQSIDFVKSGVFRGKISNNRDRNSIALENATGKRLEILPNDTATFLVDKIGIGKAASPDDMIVSYPANSGGVGLSSFTTVQRDAKTFEAGAEIWNIDTTISERYDGAVWSQSGGKRESCIVSAFQNTQPTLIIALDSYVRARLGGGQTISNQKNFTLGTDGAVYSGNGYRGVVTITFDYHIPPSLLDTKGYAFAIGRDGTPLTNSLHENNDVHNSSEYIQGACTTLVELANGAEITLRVKQIVGTLEDDITFRNVSITFS